MKQVTARLLHAKAFEFLAVVGQDPLQTPLGATVGRAHVVAQEGQHGVRRDLAHDESGQAYEHAASYCFPIAAVPHSYLSPIGALE